METDDFQNVLNVNVVGSFICAREAFNIFKKQGRGGRSVQLSTYCLVIKYDLNVAEILTRLCRDRRIT